MTDLNPRHAKFVDLMVKGDLTQEEAYIRSGFSKHGARFHASRLVTKGNIRAAIDARRGVVAIAREQKTVASILDCEAKLTRSLFGSTHAQDIAELEADLAELRKAIEDMKAVREAKEISPEALASLSASIGNLTDSLIDKRVAIKALKLKQEALQDKAAEMLMKAKGVFDPKRPPVDDLNVILNEMARSMIRAKVQPSTLMDALEAQAKDAKYSLRAGDAGGDGGPPDGGENPAGARVLFVRASSRHATP